MTPIRSTKTILFCCNSVFGMVNFRGGIIRALVAHGHDVVVVAPTDGYVDALRQLGARHVDWRLVGRGTGLLSEIAAVRQLRRIYRDVQPDVTYHFTIKAVIYGAIAAKTLGIPFVSVVTGLGYAFINANWVSRVAIALYRLTLIWSKEVWLLNEDDHQALEQHGLLRGARVRILPGEGVDTTSFHPQSTEHTPPLRFLLVARLLRDKGITEFVEAARQLRQQGVAAEFLLLGAVDADNLTAIPREEVAGWEAEGIVTHLGVTRDVRPHVAASDCVVLPSYREGLPRSLLEASAMERPIIATDVPGCKQVVIDGETGLLCKPRDAADLARTMAEFARMSPEARAEMGRRGRQFVIDRFDERLILDLYWESLSLPPRQPAA